MVDVEILTIVIMLSSGVACCFVIYKIYNDGGRRSFHSTKQQCTNMEALHDLHPRTSRKLGEPAVTWLKFV